MDIDTVKNIGESILTSYNFFKAYQLRDNKQDQIDLLSDLQCDLENLDNLLKELDQELS